MQFLLSHGHISECVFSVFSLDINYVNAPLMAATPSSSVEIHFLYQTVSISMLISCKKCLQNIQRNLCTCSWNLERADLFKKYITERFRNSFIPYCVAKCDSLGS